MTRDFQKLEFVKIRFSKMELYFNNTKAIASVKYTDFIRPFYNDLYSCSICAGETADGEKLLYFLKSDVDNIYNKYVNFNPPYKNWSYWLNSDMMIFNYFLPVTTDFEYTIVYAWYDANKMKGDVFNGCKKGVFNR